MEVELCVGNAKVLVKTNYKPADGKYLFERLLDVAIAHMNIYKHKIPSEPVGKIVHISQVQNDNKGPLTWKECVEGAMKLKENGEAGYDCY